MTMKFICAENKRLLILALVSALPFVVTAPLLGFYSDDFGSLVARPDDSLLDHVVFVSKLEFRPLTGAIHWWMFRIFGSFETPLRYHLLSTVVHTLNAILVYKVSRSLGFTTTSSRFAFFLFMYFPLKNSAVFWPTCLSILVSLTLVAAAFLVLVNDSVARGISRRTAVASFLFPVSAGFYEQGVCAGIVFCAVVLWRSRGQLLRFSSIVAITVPMLTLGVIVLFHLNVGSKRVNTRLDAVEASSGDRGREMFESLTSLGTSVPKAYYWELVTIPRTVLGAQSLTGPLEFQNGSWPKLALVAVVMFGACIGLSRFFRCTAGNPLSNRGSFATICASALAAYAIALAPALMITLSDRVFYVPGFAFAIGLAGMLELAMGRDHVDHASFRRQMFRGLGWGIVVYSLCLTLRDVCCFAEAWRIEREVIRRLVPIVTEVPAGSRISVVNVPDFVPTQYGKAKVWPPGEEWAIPVMVRHLANRPDVMIADQKDVAFHLQRPDVFLRWDGSDFSKVSE
jgi:hypothetical protein